MPNRPFLLLSLLAPSLIASAQEAAPTARAQRDADNPMRMIIEASKLKPRKAAEPEKPTRQPERIQVRTRAAAEPVAAAAPIVVPTSASSVVEPATGQVTQTPAGAIGVASAAPAAPVEPELPPPTPRVAPAMDPVVIETPLPPLRVAQVVEPVLPRRLAERVRGDIEVVVGFTVQPDGSVRDAVIQSSTNPLVNPTVLQAVAQWRYAPIAAPREHAVQLTLHQDN